MLLDYNDEDYDETAEAANILKQFGAGPASTPSSSTSSASSPASVVSGPSSRLAAVAAAQPTSASRCDDRLVRLLTQILGQFVGQLFAVVVVAFVCHLLVRQPSTSPLPRSLTASVRRSRRIASSPPSRASRSCCFLLGDFIWPYIGFSQSHSHASAKARNAMVISDDESEAAGSEEDSDSGEREEKKTKAAKASTSLSLSLVSVLSLIFPSSFYLCAAFAVREGFQEASRHDRLQRALRHEAANSPRSPRFG